MHQETLYTVEYYCLFATLIMWNKWRHLPYFVKKGFFYIDLLLELSGTL